jgi:uncharacterized protein (DUF3084 family)
MQRNSYGRRVLVAGWASAKELFANITAERDQLRRELFTVCRERDQLRSALVDMLNSRRRLQDASADVRRLRREHDIERAEQAMRDPYRPLN